LELLILKAGADYIRIKEETFLRTGLEKASVFPMSHLRQVKRHAEELKKLGFAEVCVKKLILTEEEI
jgi:hypothetical protein